MENLGSMSRPGRKFSNASKKWKKNGGAIPEEAVQKQLRPLRIVKVVIINHRKQVVCDPELDLWSDVLRTFDMEARKRGYLYGLTYLNETEEDLQAIIDECNLDMVAGVILFGTEMSSVDDKIIRQIHKPLVIYDYEMLDGAYSSVCIDNARAVEMALNILNRAGASNVCYLSTGKDIYNFEKRREAYQSILQKGEKLLRKDTMVTLGNTIGEITEQALAYLSTHKLPDAFLMGNYQVSIGVLTAIQKLGIAVPEDLKLVGIDEVPDYIMPDMKLTYIRIPHVERAAMAMSLLDREITGYIAAVIKGIGNAALSGVMYGMLADTVEFNDWKSGIRAEGLVFSANSIGQKVGSGIGSAVLGWVLAAFGFVSSAAVQPDSAINGIRVIFLYVPLAVFAVMFIILLFYKLDEEYDGIIADCGKQLKIGNYMPV